MSNKPQTVSVSKNYHDCDLPRGSESCIPALPTHAPVYAKWWRHLKKYMILDGKNRKTKRVFRSHFAIMNERKRHAGIGPLFIIHPFSLLAIYREHFLCILWMLMFLMDPYTIVFIDSTTTGMTVYLFGTILDFLYLINIFLEFFIGYYTPINKEIVLNFRKITWRYLKSYFIVDLVSCVPYEAFLTSTAKSNKDIKVTSVQNLKLFRIFRMLTCFSYMGNLLAELQVSVSMAKCLKILVITLFINHYWACAFYGFPLLIHNGSVNLPEKSWIIQAGLLNPNLKWLTPIYRYFVSLLTASSHFFGASEGGQHIFLLSEKLLASICLISGIAYTTFVVSLYLQIFGAINIADSKYDELVYQLEEYSRAKKLPEKLQQRLKNYYKYKFQKKFFKEDAILNTLSEHLRFEILLFNCRHIVEKVMALQGLSKSVVGGLIANFKPEIYLQNDVIIKHGDPPFKMFFISHGTVAVYWSNGQEITHHEDGDFFGSIEDVSIVSVVAAEITETFSMDMTDAKYIFKLDREVAERMNKLQTDKQLEYQKLAIELSETNYKDILMDLRRGFILEKRRVR